MESVGNSYMYYGNALSTFMPTTSYSHAMNSLLPMVVSDSKFRTEVDSSLEVAPVISSLDAVSVENGAV